MTDYIGLDLERAARLYAARTGREPIVEYAVPPHGNKEREYARWRVVRFDEERECMTIALFPYIPAEKLEKTECRK